MEFWVSDHQCCVDELPGVRGADQVRPHAARARQFGLRASATQRLFQPPGEEPLKEDKETEEVIFSNQ